MIMTIDDRNINTHSVTTVAPSDWHRRHCLENHIRVDRIAASGPIYDELLDFRRELNGYSDTRFGEALDCYSELYCAYQCDVLIGTLRVTRANRGSLPCEEHFPDALLDHFRPQICSANSFQMLPNISTTLRVARLLIEAAWIDQLPRGIRFDLISANERAIAYYQRLGYRLVQDSQFVHPQHGTNSHVLVFVSAPQMNSPLAPLFADIADSYSYDDVELWAILAPTRSRRPKRLRDI